MRLHRRVSGVRAEHSSLRRVAPLVGVERGHDLRVEAVLERQLDVAEDAQGGRGLLAREAESLHRAAGGELGTTERPAFALGDDPAQRLLPVTIPPDESIDRWISR